MTIGLDSIVVRSDQQISTEVNGEIVMMSVEQGSYFGIGGVGTEIWHLIAEPRSARDVCAALIESFDVDPATCETETLGFLTTLSDAGLVEVVAPSVPTH